MENLENNSSKPLLENENLWTNHVEKLKKLSKVGDRNKNLFILKPVNEWIDIAKKTPIPNMLFGELWFENEICVLFSDSNLGKSILSVQIANSISSGVPILGFILEAPKQIVLYFDFELNAKQFEIRYSVQNKEQKKCENHYLFDDNFIRVEINPEADIPENCKFEDYLTESIEKEIIKTGAKVLIIDNITFLKNENENSKNALPLMKLLKSLKNKYGLSILVLAHTPKREMSRPITQNDLQGSKMIFNFTDSCFAIGASNLDKNLRYIKQLKERNTEKIYDCENVIICEIEKNNNFLSFKFLQYGREMEHLKQYTESEKDIRISQAKELKASGYTNVAIGKSLGVSKATIRKWIKKENYE